MSDKKALYRCIFTIVVLVLIPAVFSVIRFWNVHPSGNPFTLASLVVVGEVAVYSLAAFIIITAVGFVLPLSLFMLDENENHDPSPWIVACAVYLAIIMVLLSRISFN